jgi:uncharacterized protein (TIGR02646 family)
MKHIQKGNPPAELHKWLNGQPMENGERINAKYENMPPEVKQVVKQRLLQEQGGLCCYTGSAIDENTSHIEHLKPQNACVNHEDVDYNNLLAAFPSDDYEKQHGSCAYGAHKKAGWYDETLLISPLRAGCESRFRFNQFGGIAPANESDRAAIETIAHLGLDHEKLVDNRRTAIFETLFRDPRSAKRLADIAQNYCRRNPQNRFPKFCFVIAQVSQQLLAKAENERKRKKYSQKQGRT